MVIGQDNVMTNLLTRYATPEGTKAYADALWADTPSISPDYWRIMEGLTVGKLAFNRSLAPLTCTLHELLPQLHNQGINAWYAHDPEMQAAVKIFFEQEPHKRESVVLHCAARANHVAEDIARATENCGTPPDIAVLMADFPPEPVNADNMLTALTALEEAVKEGYIQFYGIADARLTFPQNHADWQSLSTYHKTAQEAAYKAWGRRKRPLLRMVQFPFNIIETEAIALENQEALTFNTPEAVSVLELASRMHMAVGADRPLLALAGRDWVRLTMASEQGKHYSDVLSEKRPPRWCDIGVNDLASMALGVVTSTPAITYALYDAGADVTPDTLAHFLELPDWLDVAAVFSSLDK